MLNLINAISLKELTLLLSDLVKLLSQVLIVFHIF